MNKLILLIFCFLFLSACKKIQCKKGHDVVVQDTKTSVFNSELTKENKILHICDEYSEFYSPPIEGMSR